MIEIDWGRDRKWATRWLSCMITNHEQLQKVIDFDIILFFLSFFLF